MATEDALLRRLGYNFSDITLLSAALTHRSAGGDNNERLEFLGDAILGVVIADTLFQRYPTASEGELSRLRATLVKRQTLAELARDMALGDYIRLGSGELKSGGFRRDSILADALEALFGAVYLDAGFEVCQTLIRTLYAERLQALPEDAGALKDPKTRLQEYLQGRGLPLPSYTVLSVQGEAHAQSFEVECCVADLEKCAQGRGSSRRRAEQQAAQTLLAWLEAK